MKTAKILALIMTLAMLLSALLIPVDAMVLAGDGDNTYSGDPTALLLKDTTLDSGFQQSVWGTPTIDGTKDSLYQDYAHVRSNADNKSTGAYFDLWYANTSTHLYFYLNVKKLPSSFSDGNDLARFYLDFYNQHDKIEAAKGKNYQKYIESNTNYTDVKKFIGGQFTYTIKADGTATVDADKTAYMGASADGNYSYTKVSANEYILEGKILFPEYITAEINKGERPVIGVGHEIRNKVGNNTERYVLGYFDSDSYNYASLNEWGAIYDDYTLCPDLVLAASEEDNCYISSGCYVTDKEFTADAKMDGTEGWSSLPYAKLDSYGSVITSTSVAIPDHNVYLSTNGNELCIFIDGARALNEVFIFIQFDPNLKKNSANAIDKFVYFRYGGVRNYTQAFHSNGKQYTSTDGSAIGGTTFAFNDDKSKFELIMPLPSDVKTKLETGDVTFYMNTMVRHYVDKQAANPIDNYYCNVTSSAYNPNASFNWDKAQTAVILPRYTEIPEPEEIRSAVQYEGFQVHDTDGKIRFVASLKGNYTEYSEIGFEFTNNGTKGEVNCTKVYTSILADGEKLLPATFKADYFFCYTMHTFPEGTYDSFSVRCWTIKNGETEKQYSESRDYSFTVDANGDITVAK